MDISIGHGTHLPVLIKIMGITDGAVLELGTGLFSTPFLHWACYLSKRTLVSYDCEIDYFKEYLKFENDFHKVFYTRNWDSVDLSGHWSVVLVDHSPAIRRKEEIKRLAHSADYIIVHDTNPRINHHYKFSEIYPLFKYRKDFKYEKPYTTVLSNFKDLSNL